MADWFFDRLMSSTMLEEKAPANRQKLNLELLFYNHGGERKTRLFTNQFVDYGANLRLTSCMTVVRMTGQFSFSEEEVSCAWHPCQKEDHAVIPEPLHPPCFQVQTLVYELLQKLESADDTLFGSHLDLDMPKAQVAYAGTIPVGISSIFHRGHGPNLSPSIL
ncbi:unnamed protein product [Ilex paraguariensis]|uniref:Uncharacterized protein n=1 Tax=Ilex paraguariensis TaxID=185542 RepID=A0ABC8RSY7_9AQUA